MPQPKRRIVANQKVRAARALEVFKLLTRNAKGRKAFKANPRRAFNDARRRSKLPQLQKAKYNDIPDKSRAALEALSIYELQLLSELDATFVADGLFVDVPSPGSLHYH
jgi:hypothetical protein